MSTLASCRWGLRHINDKVMPVLQRELETRIFNNQTLKIDFLRATLEPYLINFSEIISGLHRVTTEDIFSDVVGKISLEWLTLYSNISTNTLQDLVTAAVKYNPKSDVIPLLQNRIHSHNWLNEEQRGIWMGVLFMLDFENNTELLLNYAEENCSRFWSFKNGFKNCRRENHLTANQNYFIVSKFGDCFVNEDAPPSGFVGNEHPWEATEFLLSRANDLAADFSNEVPDLLRQLVANLSSSTKFHNSIKHLYSQHIRMRAESIMRNVSLEGVRSILCNESPFTLLDFQSVILDELELLQRRLKNSPTNDYLTFWKGDVPHDENYCRDRIVAALNPYLDKFQIRSHTEGTMPNGKRCDFLNTFRNMDLPVEVKGQWHRDLWTAAITQLEDYSKEYRAEGFGIYLVLWFSQVSDKSSKNPIRNSDGIAPTSLEEIKHLLENYYRDKISSKTKIFVLDISKPIKNDRL